MGGSVTLAVGMVIQARFPFSEVDGGKNRPCAVLGWKHNTDKNEIRVLLVPVSSFGGDPSRATPEDYCLDDEAKLSLGEGSFLRPFHFATVNVKVFAVQQRYGRLSNKALGIAITAIEKMVTLPLDGQVNLAPPRR